MADSGRGQNCEHAMRVKEAWARWEEHSGLGKPEAWSSFPWAPLILSSGLASGALSSSAGLAADCPLPGISALRFGARQEANSLAVLEGPGHTASVWSGEGQRAQPFTSAHPPTLDLDLGLGICLSLATSLDRWGNRPRSDSDALSPGSGCFLRAQDTQSCRGKR